MRSRTHGQLNGTPPNSQDVFNAVGAAQKAGALQYLHSVQSYIVDANSVWSGQTVPRFNKSIVRWPAAWTRNVISFNAQCTAKTNSDMAFAVVVDGVLQATVIGTADTVNRRYDVPIVTAGGGSTVEVWEPFNGSTTPLNNSADAPIEGGIVTGIWLPAGMSPTTPTATTAIITLGDSIVSACLNNDTTANAPECFKGTAGQLRLLAQAQGWLLASLDYGAGTLAGDGYTPAQLAANVVAVATAMGATTVKVLIQIGRNDWAYYGGIGPDTNNAAAIGTALQSFQAALPGGYSVVIATPIPQTTETIGANPEDLPVYRTAEAAVTGSNVTHISMAAVSTANLPDGVHPNTTGVAQMLAIWRTPLGL